jgi:hypothetical protein
MEKRKILYMKPEILRRFQGIACISLATVIAPLSSWAEETGPSGPPPGPPPATVPSVPQPAAIPSNLNHNTREVVKLISSGIPEDVVRTYINNSPYTFNLTPDAIIELHSMGISSGLTTEMLVHDRNIPMNANTAPVAPTMVPQQQPGVAYPTTPQPDQTAVAPDNSDYYNELSPYGTWAYQPGYGYGWSPYAGLDTSYYPWGVLGLGSWCWVNNGWCWFPHGGFYGGFGRYGYGRYGGYYGHNYGFGGHYYGGHGYWGGNHAFYGGYNHGSYGSHLAYGGGSHSFGGGGARMSGGGGHYSGGGGSAHFSGGGGGHGGSGGHR